VPLLFSLHKQKKTLHTYLFKGSQKLLNILVLFHTHSNKLSD